MEVVALPGCLAVRSELQAPAHQLPLSVSRSLNLPQLFDAVHEGLDKTSGGSLRYASQLCRERYGAAAASSTALMIF